MRASDSYVLVTGGAGFVGTNLADALAGQGHSVLLYDNLSRPGVERNLAWLLGRHPERISVITGDVRSAGLLREAVQGAEAVFHLAAQVAVTSSLADPVHDFEVNARGTLNLLEAIRSRRSPPPLIYTSTNKVLGGLERVTLRELEDRYEPDDEAIRAHGVGPEFGLDFCSPYGCSKGAADQYVLDYSRCFGLRTVVLRMSCIYGPHQCGNEDQGWVAHFVRQALAGECITFYGDGKQVRDALYVTDLLEAFHASLANISDLSGKAFNLGGGPRNTMSLIELVRMIGKLDGRAPEVMIRDWRPSDQRYYVSDIREFAAATGWSPKVGVEAGVARLYEWMRASRARGGAEAEAGWREIERLGA